MYAFEMVFYCDRCSRAARKWWRGEGGAGVWWGEWMTHTLSSILRPCESLYQCYERVPHTAEIDGDSVLRDGCLETTSTKAITSSRKRNFCIETCHIKWTPSPRQRLHKLYTKHARVVACDANDTTQYRFFQPSTLTPSQSNTVYNLVAPSPLSRTNYDFRFRA